MKKFLLKFSVFFAIWLIVYTMLYLTVPKKVYLRSDYEVMATVNSKIASNGLKGNILIGDSRVLFGLNAKAIHAINLSVVAETPIEGYYEAREMLTNKNNRIDTLFISYGYRHMNTQVAFYTNSYYYGFIDPQYLDTVRQIAASYNDANFKYQPAPGILSYISSLNTPVNNRRKENLLAFTGMFNNLYLYLTHQKNIPDGDNQLINGRLIVMPSDTVKFRHKGTYGQLLDLKPSKVIGIYFQKILQLCKARGVHVIFIQAPELESRKTAFYQKHVEWLRTTFGNDFLYDTTTYADSCFRDGGGHLNVYGANKFEAFLKKRLYGINK